MRRSRLTKTPYKFGNKLCKSIVLLGATLAYLLIGITWAEAAIVTVATAANFKPTLENLAAAFEARTQHRVRLVSASTGVLYNQILHGAPFDVFLSADATRADKIARIKHQEAHAYALGVLVYWQPREAGNIAPVDESSLRGQTQIIAVANALVAPYGRAAQEVLERLNIGQQYIVTGNNVSQAHQFVASGNARGGFVAWSQVLEENPAEFWVIPLTYYSPIEQKAVLLNPSNIAAASFMDFLYRDEASAMINQYGYQSPVAPITAMPKTSARLLTQPGS